MNAHARRCDARSAAANLASLLAAEHGAMAEFLLALADFDAARGWAELGRANLFAFLHRDLRLSRSAAFQRKAAAGLLQRFPEVETPLRDGRLCLSSIYELAQVLTADNAAEVLPRFFGLSAREARELVAELAPRPKPPVREVVTRLVGREPGEQGDAPRGDARTEALALAPPSPSPARAQFVLTSEQLGAATPQNKENLPHQVLPRMAPPREATLPLRPSDATEPLTADLRRLHVTVSRRFLAKLDAAREARGHARPGATTEAILEEALDLLLARQARRREATKERPRPERGDSGPGSAEGVAGAKAGDGGGSAKCAARAGGADEPLRGEAAPSWADGRHPGPGSSRLHIPAEVRREVWARDEGRCQWPLDGGGICGSTHRLELDHLTPVARGGPSTVANLRILCDGHNREAARRVFGARWLARRIERPQERPRGLESA